MRAAPRPDERTHQCRRLVVVHRPERHHRGVRARVEKAIRETRSAGARLLGDTARAAGEHHQFAGGEIRAVDVLRFQVFRRVGSARGIRGQWNEAEIGCVRVGEDMAGEVEPRRTFQCASRAAFVAALPARTMLEGANVRSSPVSAWLRGSGVSPGCRRRSAGEIAGSTITMPVPDAGRPERVATSRAYTTPISARSGR